MSNSNILDDKEREQAGYDATLRFQYQVDWAIYHFLKKLERNQDFVIFIEYHEDVICSNSSILNDSIEFEFYQIKTTGKSFTNSGLCQLDGKNSILGKMILGVENKKFQKHVKKLCLLTVKNINFKQPLTEIDKYLFLKELEIDETNEIYQKLEKELNIPIDQKYKEIICFKKSGLPFESSETTAKGKIAEFINFKYGNVLSNVSSIYRVLFDELKLKYENKTSFEKWDECVEKRGIENKKISKIIETDTKLDISEDIKNFIRDTLKQNGFSNIQIILQLIKKYYLYSLTDRSPFFQNSLADLRKKIPLPSDIYNSDTYFEVFEEFNLEVEKTVSLREFNRLKAVSIYEVLKNIYEKISE